MKKRARRLLLALTVLVLIVGGALIARELSRQRRDDLRHHALDLLPHVAQRIRDFHRVKVDEGRKVWEVSASEAEYYQEEDLVLVKRPRVSFFMEDGRVVALRGDEGRVFLGGQDLQQIELVGGIDIQLGDYTLQTSYVRYERDRDVIVAPEKVLITSPDFELTGSKMEVDVARQQLEMTDQVGMVLHARPEGRASGAGL